MTCIFCHVGETEEGLTSVTFHRGTRVVIVQNVPGRICDACGESYFSEETSRTLLDLAKKGFANGAEVEILKWAA